MLGFASPTILFLNTWDAPERSFCKSVFTSLSSHSTYQRYVEPCSGAFAMPLVAADAGWAPARMEASDTSLYSAIVGTMLDTGDFDALGIHLDGEKVTPLGETPVEQAADLLWLQLLTRLENRPDRPYWHTLSSDLRDRRGAHTAHLATALQTVADRLGGLRYEPLDMWAHMERVIDDPDTVVSINPPTYKAGFEKFFDTKGRLTWNEPPYEIFDPGPDIPRLVDMFEGKAALLLCQQQREPGNSAHKRPVFARYLSAGQYVYLNSNRPDEVFEITGGPKVGIRKSSTIAAPQGSRIISPTALITPDSTIDLVPVKASEADYYRSLWMHRLKADPGNMNLLVVVDGAVAGVIGYSVDSMARPYHSASDAARMMMLRFAFGAPHTTYRLTRLATMIALQRKSVDLFATPSNAIYISASEGLITQEYTRHPEAKGLRGLMKLVSRAKHPDGHKLTYQAPWRDQPIPAVVEEFLNKEEKWQTARA